MIRFVDMYSGGGLGARGALAANCRPVLAFDNWHVATRTYHDNFPTAKIITARAAEIRPAAHLRPGDVDLIISSPECTNHSVARGRQPIDEASRDTALVTLEWAEFFRPRWIILENVTRMRKWPRFREIVRGLGELGYGVREETFCASRFGVPQSRRRLFVTAELDREPRPVDTTPLKPRVASDVLDPAGTWPTSPLRSAKRAKPTLERADRAIDALGTRSSFLIVYYGSDKAGGWQGLDVPLRTVTTLDRFALVEWRNGSHQMRMLQPAELARAMGVPASHRLSHGTRRDRVRICGNGICPPVMRRVVSSLIPSSFRRP